MNIFKVKFVFFIFLTLCFSCKKVRLDALLYNRNNSIASYNLDNYTGEVDFMLDSTYSITNNLVNIFTLQSKYISETSFTKIYAIYIGDTAKIKTDSVILYLHGNKDHMDFYWQRAKLLANVGGKNKFGVLMIDYRGFGLSEGIPSEQGMYADASAALDWLKQKGMVSNKLFVYGFSLGSAPACEIMYNNYSLKSNKIILEAPFAGSVIMAQDGSRTSMSAAFFADSKIDNAKKISNIKEPLFWIHGQADDFLSIKTHGEIVYKNYKGVYKEAHRIASAGHGNIPNTMGFDAYKKVIFNFIVK